MHPGAVLFLHLFNGTHLPPESSKLRKLLLNSLQPLLPVPVRDLRIRLISLVTPIPLVQIVDLSNLHPQTPDLFPKNLKMIHATSIAYPDTLSVGSKQAHNHRRTIKAHNPK